MTALDKANFTDVMTGIAKKLEKDPHHRLLSWDHAWQHWQKFSDSATGDEDLAALHLAFYLASWGMFRGSTALLQRDYKVLVPVVHLLKPKATEQWTDRFFQDDKDVDAVADEIRKLADELTAVLKTSLIQPGEASKQITPSDTLLSKILLNTLGCVPAFDTEVKAALNAILGKFPATGDGFRRPNLIMTINLARQNQKLLEEGQALFEKHREIKYPLTKIFDLYLWHYVQTLPKPSP